MEPEAKPQVSSEGSGARLTPPLSGNLPVLTQLSGVGSGAARAAGLGLPLAQLASSDKITKDGLPGLLGT